MYVLRRLLKQFLGKYVSTKKNGYLFANCDKIEENAKFFFYLVNRPVLVLKCDQGFVDYKMKGSSQLECNKATYETIQVEKADNGMVFFKGCSFYLYLT